MYKDELIHIIESQRVILERAKDLINSDHDIHQLRDLSDEIESVLDSSSDALSDERTILEINLSTKEQDDIMRHLFGIYLDAGIWKYKDGSRFYDNQFNESISFENLKSILDYHDQELRKDLTVEMYAKGQNNIRTRIKDILKID